MADVHHTTRPTARKAHLCEGCGRTIDPGEAYARWEGLYDGAWQTVKHCRQCNQLVIDLWEVEVRGENAYGNEAYAYLPDVDWPDVALISPLWALRAERWRQQWAGQPYPEALPADGAA